MQKKNVVIYLPVFNSFKNLEEIFERFKFINLNIIKVIIIDNASIISKDAKLKIITDLKRKFFYEIIFIINEENYGIGGSKKIFYKILENLNFDYYFSILTTKRFSIHELIQSMNANIDDSVDCLFFSRFLNKENTKGYSTIRKLGNYFFIYLTRILTGCNLTDPGSIIYLKNKKCFNIISNLELSKLTNGSHFGHFLNILFFKSSSDIIIKEIAINWSEGNIKSHINGFQYSIVLLFSLIKYFFTNSFFIQIKKDFRFEKFNF